MSHCRVRSRTATPSEPYSAQGSGVMSLGGWGGHCKKAGEEIRTAIWLSRLEGQMVNVEGKGKAGATDDAKVCSWVPGKKAESTKHEDTGDDSRGRC